MLPHASEQHTRHGLSHSQVLAHVHNLHLRVSTLPLSETPRQLPPRSISINASVATALLRRGFRPRRARGQGSERTASVSHGDASFSRDRYHLRRKCES